MTRGEINEIQNGKIQINETKSSLLTKRKKNVKH